MMAALGCLGAQLPHTAPQTINVGGVVDGYNGATMEIVGGASVQIFKGMTSAGMTTSAADGKYSFIGLMTGGTPVDGFIHATATNYIDTYVYPPYPIAMDTNNATVLMLSPGTMSLLAMFSLPMGDSQMAGNAFIGAIVLDCNNEPIVGATVTTNPPGEVHYNLGGFPSKTATSTGDDGLAYIFNVPPGSVVVDADIGGQSLREHSIDARKDVVTTTIVAP